MIRYICDYCNKEFQEEIAYEQHEDNCKYSPYDKSKAISAYVCTFKFDLESFVSNYNCTEYQVFRRDDKYVTWDKLYKQEKVFIIKEDLEKLTRLKSEYSSIIILQYTSLKLPIFALIKHLFENEIKQVLQEKIDRLVEQKENFKLI